MNRLDLQTIGKHESSTLAPVQEDWQLDALLSHQCLVSPIQQSSPTECSKELIQSSYERTVLFHLLEGQLKLFITVFQAGRVCV